MKYKAPAGGMIVGNIFYPGGSMLPLEATGQSPHKMAADAGAETSWVCPNCDGGDGERVERSDGTEACDKCSMPCRKCNNFVDPFTISRWLVCERCLPRKRNALKKSE